MNDLFNNFNKTNLNLQGNQLNLIKTESVISAFVANLFSVQTKLRKRRMFSVSKSFKIAK